MRIKVLFILFFSICAISSSNGQISTKKIKVSGRVTDTNGNPLQDVVFMVDDVKWDANINSKGFYQIKIPANTKTIMVFSVKNGLKEYQYNGESTLNFEMFSSEQNTSKDNLNSEGDVNVGYGTANKDDLSSSVGVVKGSKINIYSNIYEMIAGKVPGVEVTGKKIVIRGLSSVNAGTDPLFVVDGQTVSSIDDISPYEVENISILKGSSAAMYGSRGANGVILITMKKAKKGN